MSTKSVAISYGGGGARGLAHIHVLKAVEELGIKPVALNGTSIGSIMGAAHASGMSSDELRDAVVETFTNPKEVLARFWRMRPVSVTEVISGPRTMLGNIDPVKTIRAFKPSQIPDHFDQLHIPFQAVTTDFYSQKSVVIEDGDLNQALAASSALPAVFRPVDYHGAALVDGGILNAVPYELLRDKADIVVAVDVVGGPKMAERSTPTRIEALSGASQLMMHAATRLKRELVKPDVFIEPPVSGIGVLDFLKTKAILEATKSTKEMAKRAIGDAIDQSSSPV